MSIQRTAPRGSLRNVTGAPWTPPRALVADGDLQLHQLLRDMLRKEGYLVEEAASETGMRAHLGMIDRQHRVFDLIVVDQQLPGGTGLGVIEDLRACLDPNCWCTPVIVMTRRGDADVTGEAIRLGAVTLEKPLDLDLFMRQVLALSNPARP